MPSQGFWKNKKVFLTGHTGFKGSWTALWLQQLGAEVTGFALAPETKPSLFEAAQIAKLIHHQIGDVRDLGTLQKSLQECQPEIILHMAAQPLVRYSYVSPIETYAINVMGTANLLEAAKNLKSLQAAVVITTDKVYENEERSEGYREGEALGGYDPYSSSKACAELVTAAMRRSFYSQPGSARVATARAGNVIGGGDWSLDRLIPDMMTSFSEGKLVRIRNPRSIRPWQHVLESISGYLSLAEALVQRGESFSGAWNFGPFETDARDVEYIVRKIQAIWGQGAAWELHPGEHPHEAHFLKLNIEKSVRELSWRPRWELDQALENTVSWYRQFYQDQNLARTLCLDQISSYQSELVIGATDER